MTHRERFFATVQRKPVDRPASWLGLPVPDAIPNLLKHFKVNTIDELKKIIDDDVYPICVPYNNPPTNDIGCSLAFAKSGADGRQDERTLTAPGFFEDMTDPSLVETFPWPNPEEHIDFNKCRELAKNAPDDMARMGIMWAAHFQDSCSAFGMENALITMMAYPEMYKAVIDRITKFYLDCGEIFYEATKGYLDAVLIGNDFGSQSGLMVDPDSIRKYVFPGTKALVDQAKSYGLVVVHHSCGSIYPIIDDLFDLGIDTIHPIQAKAKDMQAEKLSADFGDHGSFFGGVDAQYLLVNGTPDDVKEDVRRLKQIFPTGLVISPSHEAVLPDIKPENIEALFQAVKEDNNPKIEKNMKRRYGQVIGVAPGKLEEYKKLHSAVWPKVLEMIKECHLENYSIYYKDGYLFSYYEYTGDNYEADMAKMAADPETQRWWDVCMPCQQPVPNRAEGEWWADMEEVFHLD
ncbi:MAG: L-rhamnose mutarotase [Bacteroidaceae bacterium]|nr:L-rhamnose mutarotase [Bacteroidaceae bacterium]